MRDTQHALIVLAAGGSAQASAVKREVAARGGKVLHSYGPSVLVFAGDAGLVLSVREHPGVLGVYTGAVEDDIPDLDETGQMGIAAWNKALSPSFREAKQQRRGEGLPWDENEK